MLGKVLLQKLYENMDNLQAAFSSEGYNSGVDGGALEILQKKPGIEDKHDLGGALAQSLEAQPSTTFWRSYLKDMKPCKIPQSLGVDSARKVEFVKINFQDTKLLYAFCDHYEFTPAHVFKALWTLVLQAYTGESSVSFGYSIPDLNSDMLVQYTVLAQDRSVLDLLKHVRKDEIDHLEHRIESMTEFLHGLEFEKFPFNTGVVFNHNAASRVSIRPVLIIRETVGYDLLAAIETSEDSIAIELQYESSYSSLPQIRSIGSTFQRILVTMLQHPELPLSNIDSVGDEDYNKMLSWNTEDLSSSTVCVHDLIKQQVSLSLQAEAICSWDGSMTYTVLDEISSRLAHRLMELGVGPEIIVPFCFEKSKWAVVSVLAIMKAV